MLEQTSQAKWFSRRLGFGVERNEEQEFLRVGDDVLESEELTNKLYEFYIALLANEWMGGPKADGGSKTSAIQDIGEAYFYGFYYPCVERLVLTSQVDMANDLPGSYAGLVVKDLGDLVFLSAREGPPPRGFIPPGRGRTFSVNVFHRSRRKADRIEFNSYPIVLMPSGKLLSCVAGQGSPDSTFRAGAFGGSICAITMNAWADQRHLWTVETSEQILGKRWRTPLKLGVAERHVKSLFYAREAPLTDTGRRRPILHWVRAHERRLASGIDVDVSRHLRGVIEFEMAGMPFRITSPLRSRPA